jgi:hypothetical protein
VKKVLIRLTVVAFVAAAAYGGYRLIKQLPHRQQEVATVKVRRGDVVIRSYSRGEMRAVRSVTLTAPNLFSTVQVTRLAPLGSLAREKDLIVEFDDSERRAQLEETLLEVEQIDEQIKKAKADLAIRNNSDQVSLLNARYGVRRSELEVKRNELLSAIDAKKNLLTLEESRRRLKQLESDVKSRQEQAQAELAVLNEQRNRAMIELNREKLRIAQAKLLAPMTGLVAIRQNRTGMYFPGMQIPDIREGDTLQPGIPVADILDLSEMELVAKVGELDRANLREGQDALVTLDAITGKQFKGKIKSMSGQAAANMWSGDPAKKFDVVFSIDMAALLKELGAKPEDIRRIMETAAANARKGIPTTAQQAPMMAMMGGPGGEPSGGDAGGAGGQRRFVRQGGGEGGAGGQGEGRQGGRSQMSPEDRDKMRKLLEKELGGKQVQDLSPEERQKVMAKVREAMGGAQPGRGGANQQAGARAGGQRGGPPGIPGMPGLGGPGGMMFSTPARLPSEEERAKAKLPLPPEEDSQLQVLLRPGLLSDIEIIIEKIPNALHVPAQAVFEKEGKPIVYVRNGSRWEERAVQLGKRSESTMVLASGVKEGEVLALSDPYAKKGDDKKGGEKKAPGAAPMMPGGGGGARGGGGGRS